MYTLCMEKNLIQTNWNLSQIYSSKEEFEMDEYKKILTDLGIDGKYEGIGHCILGYVEGERPKALPRKENRVFWIE